MDCALLVGEDVIIQPSLYRKGMHHSLHSIFKYLAHGYSHKKMREIQCDILPETVETVRDILVQRNPNFFPENISNIMPQDFKVLVDENLSPEITGYLKTHFYKVAHIHDVKLTGKKDNEVLKWAIDEGYSIIFTKDAANKTERDLTYLATDGAKSILREKDQKPLGNNNLSDIPIIIHLPGKCNEETELKKLLDGNRREFFDYLTNRATPYLDIKDGKIICGPTYLELRGGNYVQDNMISQADFKYKKETFEFFKALWLGRLSLTDLRKMTPERESKVDAQIEAYFAERHKWQAEQKAKLARRLELQEKNQDRIRHQLHASLV